VRKALASISPLLLHLGISTNTNLCPPPRQDGATPVFIAAQEKQVAALELLIKANADVNNATQVRGFRSLRPTKRC